MITNERQYRITKAEVKRFRQAIADAEGRSSNLSPRMHRAMLDGLESQLSDLVGELEEYDALQEGRKRQIEVSSLEELPRLLVMARIAAHLTQADLAHRLGVHEQQIQRYEATSYASASLARLIETAAALELSIRVTGDLPQPGRGARPEVGSIA